MRLLSPARFQIAGLELRLDSAAITSALARLDALYGELDQRIEAFAAQPHNPHLCHAGCSACCKTGAFFALTLVEALAWARGVSELDAPTRQRVQDEARALLSLQRQHGLGDAGELRDEPGFSHRIAALCRAQRPPCPLLRDELCSTYGTRPLLCRAYGVPVDAYAVDRDGALMFRSLCALYEGATLHDYVRARDLRQELTELSRALLAHDGREIGRFTSAEAILAELC